MAMPTNFWRNEQMLNIFRTKPCQRLARDGVCRWRSQCQYSHCPEWPRRQPRKHAYSPEVCPHIQVTAGAPGGPTQIESRCPAGLSCPKAHSKEEVLFHPHFFKTSLCKEHASNAAQRARGSRGARRHRCHRYYCPFAHGTEELRASPLSEQQRERLLRALEMFPSDDCCTACTRYWLTPYQRVEDRCCGSGPLELEDRCAAVIDLESHLPFPWPQQAVQVPAGPHLWELLPGGHGQAQARGPWEARGEDAEDAEVQSAFQLPSPFKPMGVAYPSLLDKAANPWGDMPAFIDVPDSGGHGAAGARLADPLQEKVSREERSRLEAKSATRARELLGEVVYAML